MDFVLERLTSSWYLIYNLVVVKRYYTEYNREHNVPDYSIAVIEDAIQVLDTCLHADEPISLADITRETGLVKNKAFRILSTLEKHHLVERNGSGAYHLGVRFLSFGERVRGQMDLVQASQGVMDLLAAETEESIFLGVVDGCEALCVEARESQRSIRLFARVGRRSPLYVGGVPKVLLAYLPDDERQVVLDETTFEAFTSHTIRDRQELEKLLEQIREQRYIVTADDLDLGAHSIAAPIWNYEGRVVAALSIAGPSARFSADVIRRYVALVREGASDISAKLGYQVSAGVLEPA